MKIDLKKLNKDRLENLKERLSFVKFWANYVKTHNDKDWSRQQNIVINSQIKK